MEPAKPLPLNVLSLLERLDLRLDEPCSVPGCVHAHPSRGQGDEAQLLAA